MQISSLHVRASVHGAEWLSLSLSKLLDILRSCRWVLLRVCARCGAYISRRPSRGTPRFCSRMFELRTRLLIGYDARIERIVQEQPIRSAARSRALSDRRRPCVVFACCLRSQVHNEVVIWDRVITSKEEAVIHEAQLEPAYPLLDNGRGLRYGLSLSALVCVMIQRIAYGINTNMTIVLLLLLLIRRLISS